MKERDPDSRRPSDREAIEATAAAWLAQRDDGLTAEAETNFARWRAADPRHEAAVARLEAAWAALQPLRDFRPEAERHPDRDLLRTRPAGRVVRFPALAALATAAALVVGVWWLASGRHPGDAAPHRYATTVDGYERVVLADGSLLELNSNTEVNVGFTAAERRVRLVRGEAHFTVAKDAARPFSVEAAAVAVRAIGTAFNVRLGAGDVEVLVTEGKVEVAKHAGPALVAGSSREGPPASGGPTPLSASERMVIPFSPAAAVVVPIVEKVAPEVVRETLSWQGPRLVFVDRPLSEVVAEFNRRNQVQLSLADDELAKMPIGGSFRAENVEAFVRLLTRDNDFIADRPEPNRIVLRRAK
jgi:transmembrane sensor